MHVDWSSWTHLFDERGAVTHFDAESGGFWTMIGAAEEAEPPNAIPLNHTSCKHAERAFLFQIPDATLREAAWKAHLKSRRPSRRHEPRAMTKEHRRQGAEELKAVLSRAPEVQHGFSELYGKVARSEVVARLAEQGVVVDNRPPWQEEADTFDEWLHAGWHDVFRFRLAELDREIAARRPDLRSRIRVPLREQEIRDEWRSRFDDAVPDELSAWFQWHDGFDRPRHADAPFIEGMDFLSLEEALANRIEDPAWSARSWLPLLTNKAGDRWCLHVHRRSIVSFESGSPERRVLFSSLSEMVDALVDGAELWPAHPSLDAQDSWEFFCGAFGRLSIESSTRNLAFLPEAADDSLPFDPSEPWKR